jgi:hypothetical protein
MHYRIKLIGEYQSPQKPWLNITMSGYSFEGNGYAHKFHTITEAKSWLDHLKACGQKVFMTWHTKENFGEVNRDYLATL